MRYALLLIVLATACCSPSELPPELKPSQTAEEEVKRAARHWAEPRVGADFFARKYRDARTINDLREFWNRPSFDRFLDQLPELPEAQLVELIVGAYDEIVSSEWRREFWCPFGGRSSSLTRRNIAAA